MKKRTVRDIKVMGKKVLVRVDFNVPLDMKTHEISDDTRIRAALPTIQYLIEQGARVILCSHFGRPKGEVVEDMRLAPVAQRLSELLGREVAYTDDCIGSDVEAEVWEMKDGDVLLLENVRFYADEEKNDPDFAGRLATLADIFVNDAFGAAHRAHASTVGVAHYLPAVAGFLMEKEIDYLDRALATPTPPFAAVVGGAKVSDKLAMLTNILRKVDALIIGGGMCCTFFKAEGKSVGKSTVEEDKIETVKGLLMEAAQAGVKVLLPTDVVVAREFSGGVPTQVVSVLDIPDESIVMDIGPETIERYVDELSHCKTVVWNGPMGVFEYPEFKKGTESVARQLASMNATTILGGGSTAEAVEELGLAGKMSHVSTGGGAALEFLEGKKLPGVEALNDA